MSAPTTRILAMLELLQTHGRLSGSQLAERLGIERRTVRRYIRVLEDLGIPVTTEQGRYGGYMLVAGYKLPPMMFTNDETVAVSLGLLAARELGLHSDQTAVESVRAKLERVMPGALKQRLRAVTDTTRVLVPRRQADKGSLRLLLEAVHVQQSVRVLYQSPKGEALERVIDPYGLVFHRSRWYVSAYCHLRRDLRSFRLERLSELTPLQAHFQRPEHFDAGEHFRSSLQSLPRENPLSVILHTDIDTASQSFGEAVGLFQPHPQGLLLNSHTDSYLWFAQWLTQLPFGFSVVGPEPLKDAVRQRAQQLLAACGDGAE